MAVRSGRTVLNPTGAGLLISQSARLNTGRTNNERPCPGSDSYETFGRKPFHLHAVVAQKRLLLVKGVSIGHL